MCTELSNSWLQGFPDYHVLVGVSRSSGRPVPLGCTKAPGRQLLAGGQSAGLSELHSVLSAAAWLVAATNLQTGSSCTACQWLHPGAHSACEPALSSCVTEVPTCSLCGSLVHMDIAGPLCFLIVLPSLLLVAAWCTCCLRQSARLASALPVGGALRSLYHLGQPVLPLVDSSCYACHLYSLPTRHCSCICKVHRVTPEPDTRLVICAGSTSLSCGSCKCR